MNAEKPDWLKYELLAKEIYSKLEPNAVVKHNVKIFGHLSNRDRQIDLSIRSEIGGSEILVIVEAKDRSRPPTVETIDAFAQKMRDVSAHRGIIICRKQPSRKNVQYAKKHGIDICTAIDIRHHKWEKHIIIPTVVNFKEYRIDLVDGHVHINTPTLHIDIPNKWLLSEDKGKSFKLIREYVLDFVLKKNLITGSFRFKPPKKLTICHGQQDGQPRYWHPYKCTIAIKIINRSLFRYSTPIEYQALRNYSNGQTRVAHMNITLPHPNDSSQWEDASKIKLDTFERFTIANIVLGEFGLFGTKMDAPEVIHQEVRHLEKRISGDRQF